MPDNRRDSTRNKHPWTVSNDPEELAAQLVWEYAAYIKRLALSILGDPSEADDTAQEVLISACRGLEAFRGEAQPRTWITSITVNACRSRLRRRKVRQVLQGALESLHLLSSTHTGLEEAAIQSEADRELWQTVDALDDKHRIPVILRYVQELTIPEIAGILGVSEGTVHSRLHYARRKLHTQLGAQFELEPAPLEEIPS